jgi:hypothetical protein
MQWLLTRDADLCQQAANGIGGQREFPLDQRRHAAPSGKPISIARDFFHGIIDNETSETPTLLAAAASVALDSKCHICHRLLASKRER